MKILITGGAGYIGSVLSRFLVRRGDEVTVLDRMVFGCHLPVGQQGLRIVIGDIRDDALVASVVRGQDAIVHLAFASNDPEYRLDPQLAAAINLAPLPGLLQHGAAYGVKHFVFLSSCSVYGHAMHDEVDEATPCAPLTQYALHKAQCEAIIRDFAAGAKMHCTLLRPATVCGSSPRQRLDLLLNRMLVQAALDGVISPTGGNALRPSVGLATLVRAIRFVLTLAEAHGVPQSLPTSLVQTFNVCDQTLSVAQWAAFIALQIGCHAAAAQEVPSVDRRSYRVSNARLRDAGFSHAGPVWEALTPLWHRLTQGDLLGRGREAVFDNLAMQRQHDFASPARGDMVLP